MKLYDKSSSAHRTYLLFKTFVVINVIRFLWSLKICIGYTNPLQYTIHYLKALTIANNSLL